jgi:hypothetical protein
MILLIAYLVESGPVTLYFDRFRRTDYRSIIEKETVDINALKGMDLTSDEWVSYYLLFSTIVKSFMFLG